MEDQLLEIKTRIKILKAAPVVFEAIADPEKMSNYFISQGSGRLEAGKEITWKFPEFDMTFPVRVDRVVQDQYLSFYWDVDGKPLLVEISLAPLKDSTVVTVTEKSMPADQAGLNWLKGNTEGWANFLACLKAYVEYGINLRTGAFDFPREET
ncbi:MAG TPA: SRPBCC domain-containing protein [Sphingobacteriaceae bacterium]